MGLRDELEQGKPPAICFVGRLLKQLPDEIAAELQELLDDPIISNVALERLSKKKEWNTASSSFGRHRKGECKCR
jgi:hypothetical protein